MPCKDLISYEIKPLTTETETVDALALFEDLQIEQLPLVNADNKYIGIISFELVEHSKLTTLGAMQAQIPLLKAAVRENAFPYRAAKVMYENKLEIIPVVNDEDVYQGVITKSGLADFFIKDTGIMQPGGTVILAVKTFDYSLSEIARICETNDVLILNLQIKSIADEDVMHIILKTNTKDLGAVEAAFNRYEYNVTIIEGDPKTNDLVQERYEMLMNFLNL